MRNIWLVVGLIAVVSTAHAKTKKSDQLAMAPTAEATVEAKATIIDESPTRLRLTVGSGFVRYVPDFAEKTASGAIGYSLNLGFMVRPVSSIGWWIGPDLGIQVWTFNPNAAYNALGGTEEIPAGIDFKVRHYGIPLLLSTMYRFEFSSWFKPYVGISAGPNIYINHYQATAADGRSASVGDSKVLMQVVARPGVDFQFTRVLALNVDGKVGVLDGKALISPSLNLGLTF